MEPDKSQCGAECICDGPGHCPCYGTKLTKRLHTKCKTSQKWRDNFAQFFKRIACDETKAFGSAKADAVMEEIRQREIARKEEEKDLDLAMAEIQSQSQGSDVNGLGDLVEGVLTKFGITSENIEKALGVQDCGCSKRKQFLNKLFPFTRKNDQQKKETDTE
jgi:hypothetical protein